jgi:hypothetical protein
VQDSNFGKPDPFFTDIFYTPLGWRPVSLCHFLLSSMQDSRPTEINK